MKNKAFLLILALSFLAQSCATKTESGALIGGASGAAVGAGVGAAVGGKEGALIGGAVGAVAGGMTGAMIGHYMDKQEADLRQNVKSATIIRQGDQLIVRFPSGILFDTGKSELKAASQTGLTEFATVLKKYPDTDLTVEGHTDNTGSMAINKPLSVSRAESVRSYLSAKNVASSRMTAVGYADERPVATNSTADGRQQNRRVEIKIVANEKLKKQDAQAARK